MGRVDFAWNYIYYCVVHMYDGTRYPYCFDFARQREYWHSYLFTYLFLCSHKKEKIRFIFTSKERGMIKRYHNFNFPISKQITIPP